MTEMQLEQLQADLIDFIIDGDQDSVEELISDGASVHSNYGQPLRTAVENNNLEIAKILVEKYKSNVNVMDGAPLRVAVERQNYEMAEMLLKNNANPNLKQKVVLKKQVDTRFTIKSKKNNSIRFAKSVVSILSIAVSNNDVNMTNLLLSFGSKIEEDAFCILQCVSSPEMLDLIAKNMNLNLLNLKKSELKLNEENLEGLVDRVIKKVKLINKIEAV